MSKQPKSDDEGRRAVIRNRKAWHEYLIEDTFEAGLVLTGNEVKSVRAGKVTLTGGFVYIEDGQAWLRDVYIAPYEQGSYTNLDPHRLRKLLLHKREIARLSGRSRESGWTMVPLSIYFARGKAKLEVGLAKGKRAYDKRTALRDRETERERARAMSSRGRDD